MCNIKKSIILFLFFMMFVNVSFAFMTEYQVEEEQQQNNFVAGQEWSYETRKHEQNSKLIVLKVDYFEEAIVVHVRLENIRLEDPNAPQGIRTMVPHMAFLQTALQESVVNLLNENKRLPEFSKEYQHWREGDGIGSAWAWHYSVSEALNGLERSYVKEQQSSILRSKDISN